MSTVRAFQNRYTGETLFLNAGAGCCVIVIVPCSCCYDSRCSNARKQVPKVHLAVWQIPRGVAPPSQLPNAEPVDPCNSICRQPAWHLLLVLASLAATVHNLSMRQPPHGHICCSMLVVMFDARLRDTYWVVQNSSFDMNTEQVALHFGVCTTVAVTTVLTWCKTSVQLVPML